MWNFNHSANFVNELCFFWVNFKSRFTFSETRYFDSVTAHLDLILEYWIEHDTNGYLCVKFVLSTGISFMGVSHEVPTLLNTYQNHFSNLIETYFDKKKFHGTFFKFSMELYKQHFNTTCGVQIQISMEFHGPFAMLPSFMAFLGSYNFPKKSSTDIHGTFWISMEFYDIKKSYS